MTPLINILTRRIPVLVLMLALLMQTLNRGCIVWSYYINTAAYAKNCENKAKPKLHCNGKCQMMKKMRQEENKEKQNPERRTNTDEVISSKSFFLVLHYKHPASNIVYPDYSSAKPQDYSIEFFHPPGA